MLCGKPGNDNGLPSADGKVGRSPHTGKPMRTLNCDEDGNAVHIVASDQGGRRGGWDGGI